MISRSPNILMWFLAAPFVALSLAAFAPLPDSVDRILKGLAIVFWLISFGVYWREDRRKQKPDQSSSAAI